MSRSSVIRFQFDLSPWRDDALCAHDENPDRWFPDSDDVDAITALQEICYQCPVRHQCAEYVLKSGNGNGVWAGFYIDPDKLGESRERVARWLRRNA